MSDGTPAEVRESRARTNRQHPLLVWAAIIPASGVLISAGIALGPILNSPPDIEHLKAQAAQLVQEKRECERRLRDSQQLLEERKSEIRGLEHDKRAIQSALGSAQADLKTCRSDCNDLSDANKTLLDNLSDEKAKATTLSDTVTQLETHSAELENKIDGLKKQIGILEKEIDDLRNGNGPDPRGPRKPSSERQMLPFARQWVDVPYDRVHAEGLRIHMARIAKSGGQRGHVIHLRIESTDGNIGRKGYRAGDTVRFRYGGQAYALRIHDVRLVDQDKKTGRVEMSID